MSEYDNIEIKRRIDKKSVNRIGWALSALMFFSQMGAFISIAIFKRVFPGLTQTSIYNFMISTLPIYLIGLPIFFLIIRKVPKETVNETHKLNLIQVIKFLIISFAAMYIFNILALIINFGLSILKGSQIVNPLTDFLSKVNIFQTAFFVGILAPIMEELIFRKILLSRLRRFGDFFSIVLSALAFGMFHGNLSQFFYAFALGCIFAYIVIKTGTIKYSVMLHVIINLLGSVILPSITLKQNLILNGMVGLFVLVIMAAGVILFTLNIDKIVLHKGDFNLSKTEQFGLIFKNPGMIIYSIMFVILVAIVIIVK